MNSNNLKCPDRIIDAVLDTDAFNEIDDQFALSFILRSTEKINLKAVIAAPFLNSKVSSEKEGMELSFNEIKKVMNLVRDDFSDSLDFNTFYGKGLPPVYKGAELFLKNAETPSISEGAKKIIELAKVHSKENPLYVIAIGAITNIASALIMEPEIAEKIVVVWLGGQAHHYEGYKEFNMRQDIPAAKIIFESQVPFIQLPARGVVSAFTTTRYELEHWFYGKGKLSQYLAENTVKHCEALNPGGSWSKPIWDVTAPAWLLNTDENGKERFMQTRVIEAPSINDDGTYNFEKHTNHLMRYVYFINRDLLFAELIKKICKQNI